MRTALDAARAALEAVSPDDRLEFRKWLQQLVDELGPPTQRTEEAESQRQSGVTVAVRELLKDHPAGLRMKEIEDHLEGHVATTSPMWRNMVQSAVTKMRKRGEVVWGEEKRHRLNPAFGKLDTPAKEPAWKKIAKYIHSMNRPVTMAEIVEAVGLSPNTVASALWTRATKRYFRSFKDPAGGEQKWELAPPEKDTLVPFWEAFKE